MLLKGKTAIVTGGAGVRGLGLAIARLFADHGARVAILDLDGDAAKDAVRSLKGRGHMGAACDIARKAQVDRVVARVVKRFGRIDSLINNAGVVSPERVMEVTEASYSRIMNINMLGALLMTQAVVPIMRAQKSGSIVNVSSVAAQRGGGIFGGSHYAASKAAMLGYTKATARELGPDNIRVNAICPSYIDTDITAGQMSPDQLKAIIAAVPLGRAGQAGEVAGGALFLASDLSTYVTGSELDINGGSHIH
jgi:NAD(P)-dependent dehydrogenase (short-subunit alcohol dehydrogenase family)